jgi:CubicO group peptidase (beta-lactamase class C family)/peroxiredoxin
MERKIQRLLIVLAAAAAATAIAFGQTDTASRIARVENGLLPVVPVKGDRGINILERLKFYNIPGVSVAVVSDYKVDWAKGYGVMDNETKAPVTEKTLFVAGSVSKPVAAMGALRLVQEGRLSLDADINAALRSWKLPENEFTKTKKATLRLILSHNAGLTVHGFRGYAAGEPVPMLKQILDGDPPANSAPIRVDTEPGKIWRYSGGGLTIMQQAMIDTEKKGFPEILRERVFEPLDMTSSSYEQTLTPDRLALAASGHYVNGKVIEGKRFAYPEMAAAGLWTTPADLAKLAIEEQLSIQGKSNKVLSQDTARLMVTPRIKIAEGQNMALGFFLEKNDRYFGHGGQDVGFICKLAAAVEGGYGAVVMTNSDGRSDALIGEIMAAIAREYGWPDYVPAPVEVIALSEDVLKPLAGRYKLDSDTAVTIRVKGSGLTIGEPGQPPADLLPVSKTEFIRRDRPIRYLFEKPGALTLRGSGFERQAVLMAAEEKVPLECLFLGKFDEAARLYRGIFAANPKDPAVEEGRLNSIGYQILGGKMAAPAVIIFRLITDLYPGSWNAFDSLGEGLAAKGDLAEAIKSYEKSLSLNPKSEAGAKKLAALKAKLQAAAPAPDLKPVSVGQALPDFTLPVFQGGEMSMAQLKGRNVLLIFPRGLAGEGHWCHVCNYQYADLAALEQAKSIRKTHNLEVVFVMPYGQEMVQQWVDKFPDQLQDIENWKNPADPSKLDERTRARMPLYKANFPQKYLYEKGKVPLPFPILLDPEHKVSRGLGIFTTEWSGAKIEQNVPTLFVIDGQGVVQLKYISQNTFDRPTAEYLLRFIEKMLK